MSAKNPIEKEIDKLGDQWEEFVDTELPILRWSIDPDANQIAFAFVKIQEEFGEDTTDFFISLHSDFDHPDTYGMTLAAELNQAVSSGLVELTREQQAGNEEESKEEHRGFAWHAPDLRRALSGYDAFIKSSKAVIDGFAEYFENLVLVISPVNVANVKGYIEWWSEISRVHRDFSVWPVNLKLVVFDNTKKPLFQDVAENWSEQICSLTPPLNLRAAINEVLNEADDGSPGAKFRKLFVDLNYGVQESDLPAIEKSSEAALALAGKHRWYDMWVSVLMLRASGLLNLGHADRAIQDYRQAQRFAEMGVKESKLGCDKLWLQALISEGSALLSLRNYEDAAIVYRHSAELAEQQGDTMMCMDSWRMESFCYEQLKQKNLAWQSALNALEAARKIDPAQVANTTAFYVGEALLRVAPDGQSEQEADKAMTELLGQDWQNLFKQGKQEKQSQQEVQGVAS